MNTRQSLPSNMNDADNFALNDGYKWGEGNPCRECGSEVWRKAIDMFEGEIVEERILCSNCGFQDVTYDG